MCKWYWSKLVPFFILSIPVNPHPSTMLTRCKFVLQSFHAIHMKNIRSPRKMIHMNGEYIVTMKILVFVLRELCVCVRQSSLSWLIKHLLRGNSQHANNKYHYHELLHHVHTLSMSDWSVLCACAHTTKLHPHLVKMCDYVIRMLSGAFILLRVHTNTCTTKWI